MPTDRIDRPRGLLPTTTLTALVVALIVTVGITVLSYRSLESREEAGDAVMRGTSTRNLLNKILIVLEQAQAGQRGFILTEDDGFLRHPALARSEIPGHLAGLRALVSTNPEVARKVDALGPVVQTRLDVIDETVALVRAGKREEAARIVANGLGRIAMEEIQDSIEVLLQQTAEELVHGNRDWSDSIRWSSYVTLGGTALLGMMLLLVGWLSSKDYRAVMLESWIRRLQLDLGGKLQADAGIETVGERVLGVSVPNLDAQVGAVYSVEPEGLHRIAGHALDADAPVRFAYGEGVIGQAAVDARVVHLEDVPEKHLTVASAVGRSVPRGVVIVPAVADGQVQAVVELGFVRRIDGTDVLALTRLGDTIANAVRAARNRTRLEALLEETQRQAEELQSQQEELRVTNEELEQQSKTLQISQVQLENQQSELEQINSQLEEQTSSLERQRDDLARSGAELQRANEYKSQFLANMSHELRTPLNSSLILAKLLTDNRSGNLTEEQIKFASTIYSAGNDLLTLINDILDLSKIEAGMLDVRVEVTSIRRVVDDLRSTFGHVAEQKRLSLQLVVSEDVPPTIETDPARLQQILRNLVSNALKFTETGGVTLTVTRAGDQIEVAVRDTGIGIAASQHASIFEAFRQADGANNRKFGGTGLGLTISRDLARLLGGDLRLESEPGRGSTFTLTVPVRAAVRSAPASYMPAPLASPRTRTATPAKPLAAARAAPFEDDRVKITPKARSLLIIEDDVTFAHVMFELAHELDFLAAVATSGDDGLALAYEHVPSAIVLDISLPDRSGLAVLDALKRDSRTRHIPVHIVSGHDYSRTALAMGAAGYALKPIDRERLVDALKLLEERITRKVSRVLIVDDDPLLRASTAKLLSGEAVETITAGTTAEALDQLRSTTFDCMVLDLTLPDRSGFELLEEIAKGEQFSFPPVIVYTGRSLTSDQLHELERFSQSIIIKGARSPERLLDEVTLFLHQVESKLPPEHQRMLRDARDREAVFEGRRVLIVEDDIRNVFALSAVLEPRGAAVLIARNGREALEIVRATPQLDLVLMDIMMPEMDGIEAMQEIRKDPRFAKLPIIALTAKAMTDDRDRCLQAGANDYIAKPLDVDKLLSLSRVWIRK